MNAAINESNQAPEFDSTQTQQNSRHSLAPAILIAVLSLIAITGIIVLTAVLWDMPLGYGTRQILLCIALGPFLAIPCLLAIWCSLGEQTAIVRITLSMALAILFYFVYVGTIKTVGIGNLPVFAYVLFGSIAISTIVLVQIPFWLFRLTTGQRLSRRKDSAVNAIQFGIKHLLIITTLVALIVWIAKYSVSMDRLGPNGAPPLSTMINFCALFIGLIWVLTLLCLPVVFSNTLRQRIWTAVLLLGVLIIVPYSLANPVEQIIYFQGRPVTVDPTVFWDVTANIFAFSTSFAVALLAVLMAFYLIGYRLKPGGP